MSRRAPALLLALFACAAEPPVDRDGDGVPAAKDCDDRDPSVGEAGVEVPYDGLDNDCRGGDVVDLDGDGWAGVARDDYPGEWPGGLQEGVDCADDPQAREDAADIHPGVTDTPYDGIDSDCAGDDDYDADGDGHAPPALPDGARIGPAREAYQATWGLDLGTVPFDDCDDGDAAVHPGASDAPYDAQDADCAGDDDYDADGDGWLPDRERWEAERAAWVAAAFGPDPFTPRWGDCLDQADPAVGVPPEQVHPGAADPAYDGVDQDCAGDPDHDADGDGYVREGDEALAEAFDLRWGGSGGWLPGDCDDTDPDVSPGALEVPGDGVDSDCDGGDGSTRLHDDGGSWAGVRALRVAASNGTVAIGVVADDHDGDGPGVYLVTVDRLHPARWLRTSRVGGEGTPEAALELVAQRDAVDVVAAWTDPDVTRLAVVRLAEAPTEWTELRREEAFFALTQLELLDVDAVLDDDGSVTAWACGPDGTVVLDTDGGPALDPAALRRDRPGHTCFASPDDPAVGVVCDDTTCTQLGHDAVWAELLDTPDQPWAERRPEAADRRQDGVVLAEPGVGVSVVGPDASWLLLEGEAVVAADGVVLEDSLHVGALVEGEDGLEAWLVEGPLDAPVARRLDTGGDVPLVIGVQPLPVQEVLVVAMALTGDAGDRVAWTLQGL